MVGFSSLVLSACSVQISFALRKQSQPTFAGVPLRDALDFKPDHRDFMVVFHEGVTNAQLAAFCADFKDCWAGHPDQGALPFVSVRGTDEKQLKTTFSKPGALTPSYLTPDEEVEDDPLEDVVESGVQSSDVWGLERIRARESRFTGRGVHAYVLDSGVRCTHQDFGGRAIPTLEVQGWFNPPGRVTVCNPTNMTCARDRRGHGTHVAGSVGGSTYGAAPQALIRVINRGHAHADANMAMDWLIQNVEWPAVLTMSFGRQRVVEVDGAAVKRVVDRGIPVVVASGNGGHSTCAFTYAWVPEVISVASSTPTDERSGFSNHGRCNDIFAPGSYTLSTDRASDFATSYKSGTSMAAPYVCGTVALLLEQNPSLKPAQVMSQLKSLALKNVLFMLEKDDPNLLLQAPM